MITGTKAKATHAYRDKDDWGVEVWRPTKSVHGTDGIIIPNGATIPLSADVRRAIRLLRELLRSQNSESEYYVNTNAGCAIAEVLGAIDKHSEKRRKVGGR